MGAGGEGTVFTYACIAQSKLDYARLSQNNNLSHTLEKVTMIFKISSVSIKSLNVMLTKCLTCLFFRNKKKQKQNLPGKYAGMRNIFYF